MKLNHIGIAVREIEEAEKLWKEALGLEPKGVEEVPTEGVKTAFFKANEGVNVCLLYTSPSPRD